MQRTWAQVLQEALDIEAEGLQKMHVNLAAQIRDAEVAFHIVVS